ncbi:glycogen synthase [Hydrogenimonas sp.]
MRVLFAAAEIFPFAKSGGLADIAHALPVAMAEEAAVTAVMPLYRFIERERFGIRPVGERLSLSFGGARYDVELFSCRSGGVETLFLHHPLLCDRDHLYGPPGEGYADNDLRFAIFCHAIVALAEKHRFTHLHLNDWHTALAAPLAHDAGLRTKILFTIHNLAYQGIFPKASITRCGIAPRHFRMEELEFFGQVNWMKGGIAHADAVTTVSPSYAVEITEPEYGCGLDGFLRVHRQKLVGILNGIDTDLFDPAEDPAIPAHFTADRIEGKRRCKEALLKEFDMDEYEHPLFIFIGRFVEQKGLDLLIETAPKLLERPVNLLVLGDGEAAYVEALERLAGRYANLRLRVGYDEALSRRMYAAADYLLMPSRFEPCGLNQMIAMRYGTLPVVHAVGGLRDTVHPLKGGVKICGLGFVFEEMRPSALLKAVDAALSLYGRERTLAEVRRFDMECDFSIASCARRYLALYRSLS